MTADIQAQLDELLWYHSIDVTPQASTKGWWELRHALPLMPFPDVKGKRCLDVGPWDGFYAYEMERRGAAEVVAVDVPDLTNLDYPPEVATFTGFDPSHSNSQDRAAGFKLLHDLFDSAVSWRGGSVYDLDARELGHFDVVIMGSLLVHLRDPVRALDAIRRVLAPGGRFLSVDFIQPSTNLVSTLTRRRPLFELRGVGTDFQWWLASDAGYRHLLHVGGFQIEASSKPFLLRPGAMGTPPSRSMSAQVQRVIRWLYCRDWTPGGHLHRAYLTSARI